MNVLHVLNELMPSGAETMLRVAGPSFRAAGCRLHVLSTGPRPGPYAEHLAAAGYEVHHLPFRKSPGFFQDVARLARRLHTDVAHLHAERAFFWYAAALRMAGVPGILRTVHNNFLFDGALKWRRGWQRRAAARLGVRFVSIAPGVDGNERARFGVAPALIPNWFDSTRFVMPSADGVARARATLGLSPDDVVLLSIGNCSDVKNHALLLHALAQVQSQGWHCLHAGTEQADEPERALAARLGIASRVRFLGSQADVLPLLHAADLFVMPSRYEGFSIAAIEALAAGTPALFAESPGLVDLRAYVDGLHFAVPALPAFAQALQARIAAGRKQADAPDLLRISATVHAAFGVERGVRDYAALYAQAATP